MPKTPYLFTCVNATTGVAYRPIDASKLPTQLREEPYFWLTGFAHALTAAQYDALYQTGAHIAEYRRMRNRHLAVATVLTAWVLITMVYRDDADLSRLLARILM
jgi:hypothetical protein